MKKEYVKCEICHINPGSEIKGGKIVINNKEIRSIFLCCKDCKAKIEDNRLCDRRNNGDINSFLTL